MVSGGKPPFGKTAPTGSGAATGDATWFIDGSLVEIYSGEDEDGAKVATEIPRG
jgi:hypothetical protein